MSHLLELKKNSAQHRKVRIVNDKPFLERCKKFESRSFDFVFSFYINLFKGVVMTDLEKRVKKLEKEVEQIQGRLERISKVSKLHNERIIKLQDALKK